MALTIQEKQNASVEFEQNKQKIHNLIVLNRRVKSENIKNQIKQLRERNNKLRIHLYTSKHSKYNGRFTEYSLCYKMFGCKYWDMTDEQMREYTRISVKKHRENKKSNKNSLQMIETDV